MKLVLKKEHQELIDKMENIIYVLSKDNIDPILLEMFSSEELENEVHKLKSLYEEYSVLLSALEDLSIKYQFHFVKNTKNLRVKFRKLNNNLENEIPERFELGLPLKSPLRTKNNSSKKVINRSKYYSSYKAK